ncbi:OmpW family outer membrane protein [Vibrio rhodolitus]|uniref:OmpW family outer membrane protein n=1 Tax=Vibrio rhodolitus TaxID=2231649 RepID=UPI000E0C35D8|nr:OmpW family outer membrane protein [Vibrio rhodolitus]
MKKTLCSLAVLSLLTSASAFAHKEGDFIVRAGLASVVPNDDSSEELGAKLEVDSDTQLGLTFGYMFTDNVSFEVLAASPFKHDISVQGAGKAGETKHLPPTFMLQYYFGTAESDFRPYVGAGINYTFFFDEKLDSGASLSLDDSWGLAANVGLDYMLNDDWFVGGSIWYADIDTTATIGGTTNVDVEIDPWVLMISGGYKF